MEITILSGTAVKVRGKHASFIVNPLALQSKIAAQAALSFDRLSQPLNTKYFEEEPLIIQGPGEYEVGGVKITGIKSGDSFLYQVTIDGIDMLIAKTSLLAKAKESITEYHVLLLDADNSADQSMITALNPNIIMFYGQKNAENAKTLGNEVAPVSKFTTTKEKLPTETQVVVLQ